MELTREELLFTSFELDSHGATKEDFLRAKTLVEEYEEHLETFIRTVKAYCGKKGIKVTKYLWDLRKKEDDICIELFKSYAQALTRKQHAILMNYWINILTKEIPGLVILNVDDSSKSIFKKTYLKDRAFQQKEDLYLNRR